MPIFSCSSALDVRNMLAHITLMHPNTEHSYSKPSCELCIIQWLQSSSSITSILLVESVLQSTRITIISTIWLLSLWLCCRFDWLLFAVNCLSIDFFPNSLYFHQIDKIKMTVCLTKYISQLNKVQSMKHRRSTSASLSIAMKRRLIFLTQLFSSCDVRRSLANTCTVIRIDSVSTICGIGVPCFVPKFKQTPNIS